MSNYQTEHPFLILSDPLAFIPNTLLITR